MIKTTIRYLFFSTFIKMLSYAIIFNYDHLER